MNLTSGNLSENTSNSDVMLLQALLRQMGQDIPEAEAGRSYFGPATKQAVGNLQVEFGLSPTGVVDQTTASKINPTTYIAAKLNADTRQIDNKPVINQILTDITFNPTFDLASTNVDTWVDTNKAKLPLSSLTPQSVVTAVMNQLKSLQRIFKITPRYDEMRLLLIMELDSANEIASIGKENFTNQAGNWPEQSDLLEFRWDPSPTLWRLYSRSNDVGGRQIAGMPATILIGTELRVYARGTTGQLLEFSRPSTTAPWQVFDRSSAFNPVPQIAGNPTLLMSGTDLHVFASGIAGQLLDFYKAAATAWQLIDISAIAHGPQIVGNPVAVQTGTDLHVYVRGSNGQLLEFYKAPNPAVWQVFDLFAATAVQVASDPVVVVTGSDVHVYVRGTDGQLLEFYKAPNPAPWQVFDLSAAVGGVRIAGTPVAATAGVDMHVYARGVGGQLLEFYKETNTAPWQVFDNTAAAGGVQIAGNLALFLTGYEVHLYTRGTLGQLLEFYKAPNSAPWQMFNHSAELGARITSDPVAMREGSTLHLFTSALCRLAPAAARRLYDSAAQIAATTQVLLARYVVEAANTVETQVMQGQRAAPNTLPNLAQMFGSLNYCDCDQCRSVYSPAAYLVDLLAFLKKPTVAGDRTILDLLLARRPDLSLLELSCENTNTPLPHIDLVNEVLEDAVMGSSAIRQTHGAPDELNATPEYVNDYAYNALSTAVYPQGMPFNLWATEARVYLGDLGVRRTEIMEAFCKTPSPGELTDNAIATEYLGLTTLEAQLITGATLPTPKSSWEFWGYTSSTPNDPDTGTPTGWVTLLNRVPVFLQQSGLTYTALTELL